MTDARSTIAVAAGAVAGAGVRWVLVETFPESSGWPWAVFVVNVVGSLLLGAVLAMTHHRTDDDTTNTLRLLVGTGFCGALTTFSTFAVDVAVFLRDQRAALATSYLVVSLAIGIVAFVVGRTTAKRMISP